MHVDKTAHYLERQPRLYSGPPQLQIVGILPRKAEHVHSSFTSFNISFILEGRGAFQCEGQQTYEVQAPCFIVQRAGPTYHYGPQTTWAECFLRYAAEDQSVFADCGLLADEDRPRPLHPLVVDLVTSLMRDCNEASSRGHPDRLDRLAERLVMEAWHLTDSVRSPSSGHAAVLAMRDRIRDDPSADHDLTALARDAGCSPGYARRMWQRYMQTNPASYLAELRHQMACERLLMSNCSIAEVADQVGYQDPRYFARRFRAFAQCSPTEWRQRHKG